MIKKEQLQIGTRYVIKDVESTYSENLQNKNHMPAFDKKMHIIGEEVIEIKPGIETILTNIPYTQNNDNLVDFMVSGSPIILTTYTDAFIRHINDNTTNVTKNKINGNKAKTKKDIL